MTHSDQRQQVVGTDGTPGAALTGVRIDSDLHYQLKVEAARQRKTVTQAVGDAVRLWLNQSENSMAEATRVGNG